MPKNRQRRINEEVKIALSESIRYIKDPRVSGLVSILRCEVTNDMRYCKVYVSIFGTEEQQQNAIKGLKSAAGWLRHELAERVDLRYTPEISIILDDSISYGAKISQIINSFHEDSAATSDCKDGSDKN